MTAKSVIMYDSPEAACWKTGIEGWVSSDGHFYGKDEHMARWAGSTHKKCDACGSINERNHYCETCRDKKMAEKFDSYPVEKWDGETSLCVFDSDIYFFDADTIYDYFDNLETNDEPRICKCKPGYLHRINEDTWCDDLPEDGDLPNEVWTALEALNAAISKADPVCWWEDEIAIDVEDLKRQVGIDKTVMEKI